MIKQAAASAQSHSKKFVSIAEAAKIAARARRAGKKVVTTNGVFDILHVGHARALAFARRQGDILMVGINSDASVRRNKGAGRPVVPSRERAEMLAALASVDYVFIFSEKEPSPWIRKIRPHSHVKSSDYSLSQIIELDAVEEGGGKVILFPHTKKHSTTYLVQKIRSAGGV